MKRLFAIPWLMVLLLLPVLVQGEDTPSPNGNVSSSPMFIRGYQKYISPVLGGKCPMHPSCSKYGAEAMEKHGPIMGWIMACDRLMRCGRDELEKSTRVRKGNLLLCNDPVSHNDFWWKSPSP